ncbi:hypothetical protein [Paenibacillus sp. A3]|uniref:hypothetical protein n=1 Tax=Paenibacillus sp. A3 TaxID=1337054 RepID=UPI000A5AF09B|nr:hypothetical protein [Paenibacillus sp. A3]
MWIFVDRFKYDDYNIYDDYHILIVGPQWFISHKPIAVAAGLGQMGIHRNVIHPKFGNFILLGTIVTLSCLPRSVNAFLRDIIENT